MNMILRQPGILRESSRGFERIEIEDDLLQTREIFLTDEVNAGTMNSLLKQLIYLNRTDPDAGITLYINSPGGEVQSGLAVYDWMKLMPAPLKTVCIGTAASMAAILFLAGDTRLMTANSRIMIHDPAPAGGSLAGRKPGEIAEQLEELRKVQAVTCTIISEITGQSEDTVYGKTRKDSWFSAEEALSFGLATGIMKGDANHEII